MATQVTIKKTISGNMVPPIYDSTGRYRNSDSQLDALYNPGDVVTFDNLLATALIAAGYAQ